MIHSSPLLFFTISSSDARHHTQRSRYGREYGDYDF